MSIKRIEDCITVDEDDVKKYIAYNYSPGDIYSEEELCSWAIENGFVKKENDE
jgi:hypothetical protein